MLAYPFAFAIKWVSAKHNIYYVFNILSARCCFLNRSNERRANDLGITVQDEQFRVDA